MERIVETARHFSEADVVGEGQKLCRKGTGKKSRQLTTRLDNVWQSCGTSRQFPTILRHVCLFVHVTEFIIKRHESVNTWQVLTILRQFTTKYGNLWRNVTDFQFLAVPFLAVPFLASPFDLRRNLQEMLWNSTEGATLTKISVSKLKAWINATPYPQPLHSTVGRPLTIRVDSCSRPTSFRACPQESLSVNCFCGYVCMWIMPFSGLGCLFCTHVE